MGDPLKKIEVKYMKKIKLCILTATVFCFVSIIYADTINALKPTGTNSSKIVFANNGKAEFSILLPKHATSEDIKSANFLKQYLDKITSGDFVIIREPAISGTKFISIGITSALKKEIPDWRKKTDPLGPEGYALDIKDGNLYLYSAATRGLSFAVRALLEEDLGCRWYSWDRKSAWNYIPFDKNLQADIVSRTDKPAFKIRDPFTAISNNTVWANNNRTHCINPCQRMKGHSHYLHGWWCHTYNTICSRKNFKEHPEYFMLDSDGERSNQELCPSNPDVIDMAVKKVIQSLKANKDPEASFISISQCDNHLFCHCAECQKINKKEGTPLAAHLLLVNKVANAIRKDYPNIAITFLAYHQTQQPPKTLKLASNVMVRLCTTYDDDVHSGYDSKIFPITQQKVFLGRMKGWEKLSPSISIWDYQVDFRNYLRPYPTVYAMSENIKCYAKHKVSAVMIQGAFSSFGGERSGMRSWVFAKLLWNPKLDTEKLMRDYIYGVYGPAGDAMNKYNQLIYQAGKHGKLVEEYYGVEDFIAKSKALFGQAREALKKHNRVDLLNRIELAELPIIDLEMNYIAKNKYKHYKLVNRFNPLMKRFREIIKKNGIGATREGGNNKLYLDILTRKVRPVSPAKTWSVKDEKGEVTQIYKLSSLWKFKYVGEEKNPPGIDKYFADDFNDASWRYMRDDVAVGWEEQGMGILDGNAIYRNSFELPEKLPKLHYYLYFIACDEEAWAYINGSKVGERTVKSTGLPSEKIWNMPFAFEVGRYLHPGKNRIALRIRDSGMMGGLYRPVFIVASPTKKSINEIVNIVHYKNPYAKAKTIGIHSTNGTLYGKIVQKDPLATNGLAARLPCNGEWLVQWHVPLNLCVPGQKYQARAQLRPENDSGKGNVAYAGVYFPEHKNRNFRQKIYADQLSSKEYRWITFGKPFLPEYKNYIWFAVNGNSKIGGLFVNRIELVPIK